MRLLLISNSTGPDGGFLDHCEGELVDFVGDGVRVLFVPFAGLDEAEYGRAAVDRLERMGLTGAWADRASDPLASLAVADSVFVGGGNTFLLLDRMIATGMLDAVRQRVLQGMPYVGASAGSNIAGPTIKTTNDMPIVEPPTFAAMGLVPFHINPHYVDRDPDSSHQGETRDQRLQEFLLENDDVVVALREGAMLRIEDGEPALLGSSGARIYRRGADVVDAMAGSPIGIAIAKGP